MHNTICMPGVSCSIRWNLSHVYVASITRPPGRDPEHAWRAIQHISLLTWEWLRIPRKMSSVSEDMRVMSANFSWICPLHQRFGRWPLTEVKRSAPSPCFSNRPVRWRASNYSGHVARARLWKQSFLDTKCLMSPVNECNIIDTIFSPHSC